MLIFCNPVSSNVQKPPTNRAPRFLSRTINREIRHRTHVTKRLDNVHEDAIRNVNIPTGEPFVYDFDADLKPIGEPDEHGFRGRFVGGETTVRLALPSLPCLVLSCLILSYLSLSSLC